MKRYQSKELQELIRTETALERMGAVDDSMRATFSNMKNELMKKEEQEAKTMSLVKRKLQLINLVKSSAI